MREKKGRTLIIRMDCEKCKIENVNHKIVLKCVAYSFSESFNEISSGENIFSVLQKNDRIIYIIISLLLIILLLHICTKREKDTFWMPDPHWSPY